MFLSEIFSDALVQSNTTIDIIHGKVKFVLFKTYFLPTSKTNIVKFASAQARTTTLESLITSHKSCFG